MNKYQVGLLHHLFSCFCVNVVDLKTWQSRPVSSRSEASEVRLLESRRVDLPYVSVTPYMQWDWQMKSVLVRKRNFVVGIKPRQ